MSELRKRIVWTLLLAPFAGLISYVTQRTLGAWGGLDPVAAAIGGWLGMHVTASQAGWTLTLIFTLALSGLALWLIWKSRPAATETPTVTHTNPAVPPPTKLEDLTLDDPRNTSLSITLGGTSMMVPLDVAREHFGKWYSYILGKVKIVNLSKTEPKLIELKVLIHLKSPPSKILAMTLSPDEGVPGGNTYLASLKKVGAHKDKRFHFIELPLKLQPLEIAEGQVEFPVPEHIFDSIGGNLTAGIDHFSDANTLTVSELRSGKEIVLRLGRADYHDLKR